MALKKSAELVGLDSYTDLAVIKIDGSGYTAAELGDSDQLVVGEEVVAIGESPGSGFCRICNEWDYLRLRPHCGD